MAMVFVTTPPLKQLPALASLFCRRTPSSRTTVTLPIAPTSCTPSPLPLSNSSPCTPSGCPQPEETVAAAIASPYPPMFSTIAKMPPVEQALLLLAFITCSIVATAVGILTVSIPTLLATRRAFISMEKLQAIVRTEVPGTLASIRLSARELNDLTVQLNRLRDFLQGMPFKIQNKNRNSETGKNRDSSIMS